MKLKLLVVIGVFACINSAEIDTKKALEKASTDCKIMHDNIAKMKQDMLKECIAGFEEYRILRSSFYTGLKAKNAFILNCKFYKMLTQKIKDINAEMDSIAQFFIKNFLLGKFTSTPKIYINYWGIIKSSIPEENVELWDFCEELYSPRTTENLDLIFATFKTLELCQDFELNRIFESLNSMQNLLEQYKNIFEIITNE